MIGDVGYAELEPYKSAAGNTTTLTDTVFSTVPGAPVFVGKSPRYRSKNDKLGIDLRLADLHDVQAHVGAGHRTELLAQLLDVRALLADDHAGARGIDGDAALLVRTLDDDARHAGGVSAVHPLGALVPALIQVPIFLALLHVLRYFNRPGLTFEQNAGNVAQAIVEGSDWAAALRGEKNSTQSMAPSA